MALDGWLEDFVRRSRLGPDFAEEVERMHQPLAVRIIQRMKGQGPGFVVGLCGPQGSGKSTLVQVLAHLIGEGGLSVAVLSLDDLYLPRKAREALARNIHPLLKTRGPPGTHDVALGLKVLEGLARTGTTAIPRFDKATDDRKPETEWDKMDGPVDVVLFEGWCVGAMPQPQAALTEPVNALERDEDPEGLWRRYVNNALADDYQRLFARMNLFILLQPLSFDVVRDWRLEQEHKLALAHPGSAGVMTDAQVHRFVAHYERITRWLMAEAPARADIVIALDENRRASPPVWKGTEPSAD